MVFVFGDVEKKNKKVSWEKRGRAGRTEQGVRSHSSFNWPGIVSGPGQPLFEGTATRDLKKEKSIKTRNRPITKKISEKGKKTRRKMEHGKGTASGRVEICHARSREKPRNVRKGCKEFYPGDRLRKQESR